MPLAADAPWSDQDYRRRVAHFSSVLLCGVPVAVLLICVGFLRGAVDLVQLLGLAACTLGIGLLARLVPWDRLPQRAFLIITLLTVLVTVRLVQISGGATSPFRLLFVAILLVTVAYFEGWPLVAALSLVAAGFGVTYGDVELPAGLARFVIEGFGLLLATIIGRRTLEWLRQQRSLIAQLNEQVQQQQAQLIEATRTQTVMQLAGGIAHELNQPLTVLLAESDRLLKLAQVPGDVQPALSACLAAAERAAQIVRRLEHVTTVATKPYVGRTEISDFAPAPRTPPAA